MAALFAGLNEQAVTKKYRAGAVAAFFPAHATFAVTVLLHLDSA